MSFSSSAIGDPQSLTDKRPRGDDNSSHLGKSAKQVREDGADDSGDYNSSHPGNSDEQKTEDGPASSAAFNLYIVNRSRYHQLLRDYKAYLLQLHRQDKRHPNPNKLHKKTLSIEFDKWYNELDGLKTSDPTRYQSEFAEFNRLVEECNSGSCSVQGGKSRKYRKHNKHNKSRKSRKSRKSKKSRKHRKHKKHNKSRKY